MQNTSSSTNNRGGGTGAPPPLEPRARVLVVGPLPPPLGGVQLTIHMQLNSSLAREFELHVVDTSKRQLRWATEHPTWKTPFYFLRDAARLVKALALIRPDVVLVHAAATLSFLRDWAFMMIARLAGAKVVCHYHGTMHARFPSGETRGGRAAGRFLMAAAHRVIVLSPAYCQAFGRAWKRELAWAPNMADVALLRSLSPDTPVPWLAPGERAVLFVGRLSAPKGIYDLFDAIPLVTARHPQTVFVLAGVAECDAMESALREEVARRGIRNRVRFLGSLEGRDKALAFATAHILVVPSWTEAFPLVIPEAMAAGLPVVASAVGAIPHFVKDGEDGFLIAPRAPEALAERVCRLLADRDLHARIRARVRERAPREFSIEAGCARVVAVIRETLGDAPAGVPDPEPGGRR